MSNGDLERLHAAEAQALGVRNFYARKVHNAAFDCERITVTAAEGVLPEGATIKWNFRS
jgi:hypothetical protein